MVMSRGLRADLPPLALTFWRLVIALACLTPLAWPHLKAPWPLLRQAWKQVLLLGVCGIAGYNTLAYIALQSTTATNAALINSFVPVGKPGRSAVFVGCRAADQPRRHPCTVGVGAQRW